MLKNTLTSILNRRVERFMIFCVVHARAGKFADLTRSHTFIHRHSIINNCLELCHVFQHTSHLYGGNSDMDSTQPIVSSRRKMHMLRLCFHKQARPNCELCCTKYAHCTAAPWLLYFRLETANGDITLQFFSGEATSI